uniref:Putative mating pair formation protein n=1 Tax=Stenotrophomonas maltophilia TaxID=40324 RepID=Q7WZL4_STEMA|nr:putative mating pair formation protein [Stenotrophomonas maltophilia]
MRRVLLMTCVALALSGCSGMLRKPYISRGVSEADAASIAVEVATYIGRMHPPARTLIAIDLPRFARWRDPVAPVLAESLRRGGFAVMESDTGVMIPANAHRVSYSVSAWSDGVSVQVELDGIIASRWYVRSANGGLLAVSPFAVREVGYVR